MCPIKSSTVTGRQDIAFKYHMVLGCGDIRANRRTLKGFQYKIEFTLAHYMSDIFDHWCGHNIHPLGPG